MSTYLFLGHENSQKERVPSQAWLPSLPNLDMFQAAINIKQTPAIFRLITSGDMYVTERFANIQNLFRYQLYEVARVPKVDWSHSVIFVVLFVSGNWSDGWQRESIKLTI